jgi:hypothetical protein
MNDNKSASMDAVGEVWADIPEYEGLYKASSLGRVKSLAREVPAYNAPAKKIVMKTVHERIMSLKKYGKDYLGVTLYKNGVELKFYVQRLILSAFKGKKPEGMIACHNNGDRKDNRIENLRWDTPKNNEADKLIHGTRYFGEKHHNSKFTNEQVFWIRSGVSYEEVAQKIDISKGQYRNIVNGVAWPHLLNVEVQP